MSTSNPIKHAYLMWVGSDHYPTIDAYCKEAEALGVSKRLPNSQVAGKLLEPGTAVFIAHDEGNCEACPDCSGIVENPELRIAINRVGIQKRRLVKLEAERNNLKKAKTKDADAIERAEGFVTRGKAKLAKLEDKVKAIPATIKDATGGWIRIDGERWDYRRYNYWLHQSKKWDPAAHRVENNEMCERCGGTGRLPLGKVFGMFIPSGIEYIMRPEDSAKVKREMEAAGYHVVEPGKVLKEAKRGCGRRKAGGFYAVTKAQAKAATQDVVKQLVASGKITEADVEVSGNFIRFLRPVDIPGTKRFRGIKSWSLHPDAEEEAQLILEAVA